MAGFTNHAYRQLLREIGGPGLLTTEMVSARAFVEKDSRREAPPERLWGVRKETGPLAVQIWDNVPETLMEMGHRLVTEYKVDVIDLNFGCPARVIREKSQSGASLLAYPDRMERLIAQVVSVCTPVPVTAKIRLGLTRESINAGEVASAVESAGACALTVHGRTADQMYCGKADWDAIGKIREALRRIPLIGNGDLTTAREAARALQDFPVDGIMIGRGGVNRPWIFREIQALLRHEPPAPPSLEEQRDRLLRYHQLLTEQFGWENAVSKVRRFACAYVHGKPGARKFRGAVCRAVSEQEFRELVDSFYRHVARQSHLEGNS